MQQEKSLSEQFVEKVVRLRDLYGGDELMRRLGIKRTQLHYLLNGERVSESMKLLVDFVYKESTSQSVSGLLSEQNAKAITALSRITKQSEQDLLNAAVETLLADLKFKTKSEERRVSLSPSRPSKPSGGASALARKALQEFERSPQADSPTSEASPRRPDESPEKGDRR